MKRKVKPIFTLATLVVILCCVCFSICGCSESESTTPTGYPTGELQAELLFVNDALYVYNGKADIDDFSTLEEIGTILVEDDFNEPTKNLHSCHIAVGTSVYINTVADSDYVIYFKSLNDNEMYSAVMVNDDTAWWHSN